MSSMGSNLFAVLSGRPTMTMNVIPLTHSSVSKTYCKPGIFAQLLAVPYWLGIVLGGLPQSAFMTSNDNVLGDIRANDWFAKLT